MAFSVRKLVHQPNAWLMITLFVISGLLLSLWLYNVLAERHQRQLALEFEALAGQRTQVLENHIQRSLEVLHGLSAFLRQPQNRQLNLFRDYVKGSIERLPEVQALEWIPIIEQQQRQAFEAKAIAQGLVQYEIIEFDGHGELQPASPRPRYYPVYFAYPENTNVEAIGLDLGSQPDRRRAIEASMSTGQMVATAPIRLAQEKIETEFGFLIFSPVMGAEDEQSIGDVNPIGFALVAYRTIDLLAAVFPDLASKGVAVEVVDRHLPRLVLYSNADQVVAPMSQNGPYTSLAFELGQRQWLVSFSAAQSYLTDRQSNDVIIYPLTCAFLVLAFGAYAAFRNRYLLEVELQVQRRTKDLTHEIEQRRAAQGAAQAAEKMYRSMFENAIDGIFQTTREGVYLKANSALAKIYGYDSSEDFIENMKSIEMQLYVEPHRRQQFIQLMQRDGRVADFISEVYRADGSRIHILEKAISVYDDQGEFLYYEGNVQDITHQVAAEQALQQANEWLEDRVSQRTRDLARANQELQEEVGTRLAAEQEAAAANEAKTQFLAGISHEIRTPLNAIVGYSQILQQQPELQHRHQLAIKTIAQSSDHLLRLIDDILDLSKIESGMVELSLMDFDLAVLVNNVAYLIGRKCDDKGLGLIVEGLGSKPCWVHGDEGKLRQILVNLLSNAVKYTVQGNIILRVIPEADLHYRFEVIDTGPGIPEQDLSRIFDHFFQRAGWQEGTGLGLSIASRLARALGASIDVRSTPGLGSNFYLRIAFKPADTSTQPVPTGLPETIQLLGQQECRVMIVDDVQHNRDILQQMLEPLGCTVDTFSSGDKALAGLASYHPHIVFMDIHMPDRDGVDSRRQMLARYPELAAVFVAFSASAYQQQRQGYLDAGFDAVLNKPFQLQQLYSCLCQLLPTRFAGTDYYSAENPVEAEDYQLQAVTLDKTLADQLISAARLYRVTELRRLLQQLAQPSNAHERLAKQWRQLLDQHQLEQLIGCVEQFTAKG